MILVVSSTNRPESLTLELAKLYLAELARLVPERKAELMDLSQLPIDFITSDLYGNRSEAFRAEEQRFIEATHLIFIVPEYNGSLPGILKLWIDAFTYGLFAGKQAALVGLAAGMFGNVRGLDHLSGILNYLQVSILPFRIHLAKADQLLRSERGFRVPSVLSLIEEQVRLLFNH
jgi:NAD(P)H-dependent FMN reductase